MRKFKKKDFKIKKKITGCVVYDVSIRNALYASLLVNERKI
jgi:hypothetical protein